MADASVLHLRVTDELLLHHVGQQTALGLVCVLHQREHDQRLGRSRLVALIPGRVVLLVGDHVVFLHGYVHVLARLVDAHDVDRDSGGRRGLVAVDVDRDEQVGLGPVGDVAALGERNQHVRLAGIDHLHVRIVLADHPSEPERDVQIDVLFLVQPADGSGVGTAVSRIDYDGVYTDFPILRV